MWAFAVCIYRDLPTYHHWQLQGPSKQSSEQCDGWWNHYLFDLFHSVLSWHWWADAHDWLGEERGCGWVWCASVYVCVVCAMWR